MDEDEDDLFAEFDVDVDMDKDASETPNQAGPAAAQNANDNTAAHMDTDTHAAADNLHTADQSIHNQSLTESVEGNDSATNMTCSPTGKVVSGYL